MKRFMTRRVAAVAALVAVVGAVGGGVAVAGGANEDSEQGITGPALAKASAAALAHLGEGRVTGTEVEDEESLYEVEVTLADGVEVDVQLDAGFNVVGSENDANEQEGSNDN